MAWSKLIGFIAARTIDGIDFVDSHGSYWRTVTAEQDGEHYQGYITVKPLLLRDCVRVSFSKGLLPVVGPLLGHVRDLFDLDAAPLSSAAALAPLEELGSGINATGVRVPGAFDGFEMAVRAILGQQVTVKAASTLTRRLVEELGEPVECGVKGLSCTFPSAQRIAELPHIEDRLGQLGITSARSRAIKALAEAVVSGAIELGRSADVPLMMERTLALRGFGPWTVNYLAMRVWGWPDAFPESDYGIKLAFKQALGTEDFLAAREMRERAQAWQPYRSYAAMCLWNSLSEAH
jgi:AraC family transcriptional regulator of adaptative response / DNA-3-methyladenine glycosylase II